MIVKARTQYFLDSSFKKSVIRAVDCAGYAFLRPRQNGPVEEDIVRKILLIRLDHIGDVLMTTPAIRALRVASPDAKIHLLVKETSFPAVEFNPHLDRIIQLNAPWSTPGADRASRGEVKRIIRLLKNEGYDCIVDFRPDLREALMTREIGARYRIGYGERGGGFCFTHLVRFDPGKHEIQRALELLSPLHVTSDGNEMNFFISSAPDKEPDLGISQTDPGDGEKVIGIHPGAASPFKRWTEDGYARLSDTLIDTGYRIVLMGGPGDRDLLQSIAGRMNNDSPVVCDMDLKVLGAAIGRLDCLVCNDSAPSHIAQAVGVRTIVLYGPTHDKVTGPLDRARHTVVRHPVPCAPCWLPGTKFRCRYDFKCWRGLEVERVAKAVEEITDGGRSARAGAP